MANVLSCGRCTVLYVAPASRLSTRSYDVIIADGAATVPDRRTTGGGTSCGAVVGRWKDMLADMWCGGLVGVAGMCQMWATDSYRGAGGAVSVLGRGALLPVHVNVTVVEMMT